MDSASIVVGGGFIALTAIIIVVAKKVFIVPFLAALGIGIPTAFVIGMAAVWLLGKISDRHG